MVGYGPEDNHFVVELTYNYGIKEYKLGNDFQVCLLFHLYVTMLQLRYICGNILTYNKLFCMVPLCSLKSHHFLLIMVPLNTFLSPLFECQLQP